MPVGQLGLTPFVGCVERILLPQCVIRELQRRCGPTRHSRLQAGTISEQQVLEQYSE